MKLDMVLTPKAVSLKEVTVKPDPLRQRGDTLTHNLASFLGKGDVTLEDGLKRLPGVDVAQSGAISYMGKPISQFFAEQSDQRSSATSRGWTCLAASTTWRRGTFRRTT